MKAFSVFAMSLLFLVTTWAGVGGIGGGTTKGGFIKLKELQEILNSNQWDAGLPQVTFPGREVGSYFLTIDQVCINESLLESIRPVEQIGYSTYDSGMRTFRAILQVPLHEAMPRDFAVPFFKKSYHSNNRNFGVPVGVRTYQIPDCELVR